jgi:hypothetical protein
MSNWTTKAATTTLAALALGGVGAGIANAAPAATAAPSAHPRHPGEHVEFTRNTAKHGTVTVDLQRGVVTAVDGPRATVRSTDGYTRTYTLTPTTHVRKDEQKSQDEAVHSGDRIGIATLAGNGDARWVHDRGPAPAQPAQPSQSAPITPAPSGS